MAAAAPPFAAASYKALHELSEATHRARCDRADGAPRRNVAARRSARAKGFAGAASLLVGIRRRRFGRRPARLLFLRLLAGSRRRRFGKRLQLAAENCRDLGVPGPR